MILEIGTGSGCVAISVKNKFPDFKVFASDISEKALKIAKQNAKLHNQKIEFIHQDFLDESSWNKLPTKVDLIVSNPPYIPENQKNQMDKNVLHHEPHIALFVPDTNPLLFYEKILKFSETNLIKGGMIFFEIHEHFGNKLNDLIFKFSTTFELRKDLSGNDRMIKIII